MARSKSLAIGFHDYRLKQNPKEQAFADVWRDRYSINLADLLDPDSGGRNPVTPSLEEEQIVATIIQWLGSPVGQCFLRDAEEAYIKSYKE